MIAGDGREKRDAETRQKWDDSGGQFARTTLLFGQDKMEKLFAAKVAIFGVGGVGGYVAEALARSGVGAIDLFDKDRVSLTNLNRQIIALHSTIGRYKVDAMKARILDINPDCKVGAYRMFYLPETADEVDLSAYDYVVDAVDTVAAKIELIARAKAAGVPILSSMGAANKLDPARFLVADISRTETDPLAKAVRVGLRARGIREVKVVYSKEPPAGQFPASNAFVPPALGLVIAAEVVKDLIG